MCYPRPSSCPSCGVLLNDWPCQQGDLGSSRGHRCSRCGYYLVGCGPHGPHLPNGPYGPLGWPITFPPQQGC